MKKQTPNSTNLTHTKTLAQDIARQSLRKMQMGSRWKAADGRDAWSELNRAAYGEANSNPRKLTHEDAQTIARQLYVYLEKNEPRLKDLKIRNSDLCAKAFSGVISARELYRITLPPDADPATRGIRVSADKYVRFIEALASELRESASLIAEPILRNTSLHPLSRTCGEWSDMEKIQMSLQSIVNKIDAEFNLFATYKQTAVLKCKGVEAGGKLCWPLDTPYELAADTAIETDQETYRRAYAIAADPSQAFLRRNPYYGRRSEHQGWHLYGFETAVLQNDEFFYVPHAPLGHLLLWDLPDPRENRADYAQAVDRQVKEIQQAGGNPFAAPKDEWDAERKVPYGQTMERGSDVALQHHFWLLAYPHPDGKRLVPTLYEPGEEGGAYLLPLDIEGLEMLADTIWVSETSHRTALEHLKMLLVDESENGINSIEYNLRRTAAWLAENPVFKEERVKQESSRRLDQLFRAQ